MKHILTIITTKTKRTTTTPATILQTKMFSIFILGGLCPRRWIVTLSLMLGHIRLPYALLARNLAAAIVGKHFFQYICPCQHNLLHQSKCHLPQTTHTPTITVPTKTTLCLLIPLIPVQQQHKTTTTTTN